MLLGLFITIVAATTQTDALFTGTVPQEVPTYEVTMGGVESFFAGISLDGQWLTDHRTEINPTQRIELVPDTPGYTHNSIAAFRRNVDLKYEAPAMRRVRLEEWWTAQGYTFLETAAGWRPVAETDIQLAKRAREMAAAAQDKATSGFPPPDNPVTVESHARMSPEVLMVSRVAIILVGIALALLVIKMVLRKVPEWKGVE